MGLRDFFRRVLRHERDGPTRVALVNPTPVFFPVYFFAEESPSFEELKPKTSFEKELPCHEHSKEGKRSRPHRDHRRGGGERLSSRAGDQD